MAWRRTRPSAHDLAALLDRSRDDRLTYAPTGGSLGSTATPPRLRRREWTTALPAGSFDRAVSALNAWDVHRGAGLDVLADGGITPGTNVVLNAPLPIGYIDATCRIVAVVEESDRQGFAYGTLEVHPEQGEESFVISRTDASVRFDIVAVSRPIQPLARTIGPAAHFLQDAAVRRYLGSMQRAVGPRSHA